MDVERWIIPYHAEYVYIPISWKVVQANNQSWMAFPEIVFSCYYGEKWLFKDLKPVLEKNSYHISPRYTYTLWPRCEITSSIYHKCFTHENLIFSTNTSLIKCLKFDFKMASLSSFAEKRFGKQVWHGIIYDYSNTNIQALDNSENKY